MATRGRTRDESDREPNWMAELPALLAGRFGKSTFTIREVFDCVGKTDSDSLGVSDILTAMEAHKPAELSYRFRKYVDRNFGGRNLFSGVKGNRGVRWEVRAVGEISPGAAVSSSSSPGGHDSGSQAVAEQRFTTDTDPGDDAVWSDHRPVNSGDPVKAKSKGDL